MVIICSTNRHGEILGWFVLGCSFCHCASCTGSYAPKGVKALAEMVTGSSKVSKVTGTVKKVAKTVGKKIGSKSKKLGKIIDNFGKTNLNMKPKASGKGAGGGKAPKAACFVAGTLVTAKDGLKPIEKVKAGDFVYSENPETGEKGATEGRAPCKFATGKLVVNANILIT